MEKQLCEILRTHGTGKRIGENTGTGSGIGFDTDTGDSRAGTGDVVVSNAVLVGTSLGGFWAARFGNHFGIPAVLINPTIHPHRSLQRYVGHKLLNFVTRTRNILRDEVPASYGDIEQSGDFLVLLDKGDEVLDYRRAAEWFGSGGESIQTPDAARLDTERPDSERGNPDFQHPHETTGRTHGKPEHRYKVVIFDGGSHRFEHMDEALPHIRQFLSRPFPSQQHPSGQSPSDQSPSDQHPPR